jgi:hypothetical protein
MKKYKVVWFDDECDMLPLIKESASLNDIYLIGYNNAEDGIKELEVNILNYDAAVVDGIFFRKHGQQADAKNQNALADVALALERLMDKKKLPWFILSGQTSFTKERNSFADAFKDNKVFDKLNDEDLNTLWISIKLEADQQTETQIRHKYQRVFDVCVEKYIGSEGASHLLTILINENLENAFENPGLYFNPLRKIIEDLFVAFNKYGLLPDVFIKSSVALTESSKFLSGLMEKNYQLDAPVFPKVVSDNVRNILAVCQPAAHRAEIDTFVSQVNSPYLLLSVTYQLLDVLLWFKGFVDSNGDIEANKSRCHQVERTTTSESTVAILEKDKSGNYHCGDCILTYKHIGDKNYKEGDEIRILRIADNTNIKTMDLYSKSVIDSEKN